MGFNLLAFAGGAAKAVTEEIDKREEEAKAFALNSTKMMHERYTKTLDSNRQQLSSIEDDLGTIRSNFPGKFTESELYQIGISNAQRKQLVEAAKDPNIDKSLLDPKQIVKIIEDNTPGTAMERIRQSYAIPSVIAAKAAEVKESGFLSGFGERAGATAAQKYAGMTGVSLEQMRGAQDWKAPTSTAEFDLSSLKSKKTFAQLQDDAKVEYIKASESNDPDALKKAAIKLAVFESTKTNLKQEQTDWAEQKASLRFKALKGDKQASKELDNMIAIEDRESKKKGGGDGEGKVPSFSALSSFGAQAGNRAVDYRFGKQLGANLARTVGPDGSLSLTYIGTDRAMLAEVEKVRAEAVNSALSLYPNNRDVQTIKASYVMPNLPAEPTAADKAKPVLPSAKGGTPAAESAAIPAAAPAPAAPAKATPAGGFYGPEASAQRAADMKAKGEALTQKQKDDQAKAEAAQVKANLDEKQLRESIASAPSQKGLGVRPTSGKTLLPAAPASPLPKIKDDADYNKLKSGARFIGPDGIERVKP